MESTLRGPDWHVLLELIEEGQCTPLLGAGVVSGVLPLPSAIARQWAQEFAYPLGDADDLARVAQYLAIDHYEMFPKVALQQQFKDVAPPDFSQPDELHGLLAELPLPVYVTTNYDDFMIEALKSRGKSPRRELCRWNRLMEFFSPSVLDEGFEPTVTEPLVFHLFGQSEVPESLVLTQDDYWGFLVRVARQPDLLPRPVRRALVRSMLLFIGCSVTDWAYRVLFYGVAKSADRRLTYNSITVQPPPALADARVWRMQEAKYYLSRYYDRRDLRTYWGTAREFAAELRQRWEAFSGG
jgi:hypothetical protein